MEKLPTSSKALRYLPFLVASAFFMQMLDATILNTAIPTIARSFNSHPLQLHSLVTAYMLTVCVLIPASGWISDKLGSRRTFLFAISVFSAGSLLCALSTSVAMMTACRVIQGIGGAFLMPVGRLVVLRSYPRSMFVNVLNIVTIPALLGPLLGPVLGAANSIQFTCMNTLTLIDLPNADASSGNSLLSTIMQLSIAVSIAAASLLLDSFGGHSATSGKAVEAAFHATFVTIGAIAAASSFIFALVDKNKGITRRRKKAA